MLGFVPHRLDSLLSFLSDVRVSAASCFRPASRSLSISLLHSPVAFAIIVGYARAKRKLCVPRMRQRRDVPRSCSLCIPIKRLFCETTVHTTDWT